MRTALETTLAILRTGIERRGHPARGRRARATTSCRRSAAPSPISSRSLLNLLTNAREATHSGGLLTVEARPSAAAVDIVIADTGHGIAAEHLPRVLEPFFTTKSEGNGLGLTICRSIVWEAGGTITIDSTAGVGTRVIVTIPRASAAPALQAT